ncbi:MAG: hypothetical protein J0L97_06730 [Alphaproteobacteria bacterium]|nr:hypothetical protein [Alphaproteobacteria bacterium]
MTRRNWVATAMGMRGTLDDEELEREEVVLLVQGNNLFDQRIFCYVRVPYFSLKDIKHRMDRGENFDLREYGEVLAAGIGEPSDEIKNEIAEEFEMFPVSARAPDVEQEEIVEEEDDGSSAPPAPPQNPF